MTVLVGLAIASLSVALDRATTTTLGPRPSNGYRMEPVIYTALPLPGASVVHIANYTLDDRSLPFPSIPRLVHVNTAFSFRGRLTLPEDDSIVGVVSVEWFSIRNGGKELINTSAVAVPVKVSPGQWEYSIEQKVLLSPRDYFVRFVFRDLNSRPPRRYVMTSSDRPVRVAVRSK